MTLEKAQLLHNLAPQSLADATARSLFVIDLQGQVSLVSKLARENLQITPETGFHTAFPEFWPQVEQGLEGITGNQEFPLQVAGREYLVGINPLLDDNKIIGAVCVLVDSAQLDIMIRQLPSFNTLTRELDTIIDSSSDGLFVCDADANVIRMNPASERIHKTSAGEIVGHNMRELINSGFIGRSAALDALGVNQSTIARKLKRHGLS